MIPANCDGFRQGRLSHAMSAGLNLSPPASGQRCDTDRHGRQCPDSRPAAAPKNKRGDQGFAIAGSMPCIIPSRENSG